MPESEGNVPTVTRADYDAMATTYETYIKALLLKFGENTDLYEHSVFLTFEKLGEATHKTFEQPTYHHGIMLHLRG